jgi:hypothetical protein
MFAAGIQARGHVALMMSLAHGRDNTNRAAAMALQARASGHLVDELVAPRADPRSGIRRAARWQTVLTVMTSFAGRKKKSPAEAGLSPVNRLRSPLRQAEH